MLTERPRPRSPVVVLSARRLNHHAANLLAEFVLRGCAQDVAVIDASSVSEATTSAFARLVLLRRMLLAQKRDLILRGLHGRAARLYEVEQLDHVLPRG